MIQGIWDSGAMPVLERLVQFTEARQKVLTNDIANLSTPYFKPTDLSPDSFESALRDAIDQRRASTDPQAGPIRFADTDQIKFRAQGLDVESPDMNRGVLFHDQNNRDTDRLMQHLAENTLAHRVGIELIRSELGTLQAAIRERV